DPVITLKKAVENVRPMLEVKSRRVGGASYQVPIEVKPQRGTTLAMRWLVNFSRARRENSMSERLVAEIMDASNGAGASVKRREDMHKMAEANRAFAHYRWRMKSNSGPAPRGGCPMRSMNRGTPDGGPCDEERLGNGRPRDHEGREGTRAPR